MVQRRLLSWNSTNYLYIYHCISFNFIFANFSILLLLLFFCFALLLFLFTRWIRAIMMSFQTAQTGLSTHSKTWEKNLYETSLFNDNIKCLAAFVAKMKPLNWTLPRCTLDKKKRLGRTWAVRYAGKILNESWFFYLLQFTAMFSGKRFQLMAQQLCFMSLDQKLFTS